MVNHKVTTTFFPYLFSLHLAVILGIGLIPFDLVYTSMTSYSQSKEEEIKEIVGIGRGSRQSGSSHN